MTRRTSGRGNVDFAGSAAIALLVAVAFVTGGDSNHSGLGETITQLMALPVAVWGLARLCRETRAPFRNGAVAVALLLFATIAVQLILLPEDIWRLVAVRETLAHDLFAAGVDQASWTWSLAPLATERALWFTLPALAVFFATLVVPARFHRRLLEVVVLLVAASLLLGAVQLGVSQDSILNPFPRWAPAMNGLFANPNHQGIALAICVVMVVTLSAGDWIDGRWNRSIPSRIAWILLAAAMLISVPLTGSRAAFLLALMGLLAVPVVLRTELRSVDVLKSNLPAIKWLSLFSGLCVAGAVLAWVRFESGDSIRWTLASATAAMGWTHFPLGAGTGTFVPWFDQSAPPALVQWEYFNHAHNEVVQWWFEAGVLGLVSTLSALGVLAASYPRYSRSTAGGSNRGVALAAWLACVLLFSHAWVEYGLRTQALMTVAALLAGIVVARRVRDRNREHLSTHR